MLKVQPNNRQKILLLDIFENLDMVFRCSIAYYLEYTFI